MKMIVFKLLAYRYSECPIFLPSKKSLDAIIGHNIKLEEPLVSVGTIFLLAISL